MNTPLILTNTLHVDAAQTLDEWLEPNPLVDDPDAVPLPPVFFDRLVDRSLSLTLGPAGPAGRRSSKRMYAMPTMCGYSCVQTIGGVWTCVASLDIAAAVNAVTAARAKSAKSPEPAATAAAAVTSGPPAADATSAAICTVRQLKLLLLVGVLLVTVQLWQNRCFDWSGGE